ncbi:AbiH family protein [Flavobacterium sp. FZUC8N2.13]|uniref:AbiH family protein n=1 Tax=Flavobacterium zubiriense TaxID=3138075 RepID=A0ABV4TCP7_9FLAO
MNIVYFIGNGFDINLGMKTRYSDFYKQYNTQNSKSELIKELKNEIAEGIINWSDLELAFGKHTVKLKNIEEFDEVYEDIVDNLADYLISEEEKFDFKKVNVDSFLKQLSTPEKFLTAEDIQELQEYKNQWKNNTWNINIITLNYTTTIEKILGDKQANFQIGVHHQHQIIFKNIYHIHGYTDKRTVLGVNDISQIDKVDFHENEEILEALIKTKCNRVQRHKVDKICEKNINEAHLICIFGSSIGDTDNYWWQLIGEQLRKNIKIIIFSKGEDVKERFAQKAVRTKRSITNLFLNKTNLPQEEKNQFKDNIYVGVNTKMFNIKS